MVQKWTRILVKSHIFFALMMTVIALNVVMLSFSVDPPWIDHVVGKFVVGQAYAVKNEFACIVLVSLVEATNYACTVVYILELILKLFGLGPREYFASFFNRMDFAVRKNSYCFCYSKSAYLCHTHKILSLTLYPVCAAKSGGPVGAASTIGLISAK